MQLRSQFRKFVNLNMSFLGIQFVFSLSSGHITRVLQYYKVEVAQLPLFWMMAPITGMVMQPLIGHYADFTWNRFGRRRPYIFVGAILTAITLIMIPNADVFFQWVSSNGILGFLILLLYGALNLTMDPSRTLLADNVQAYEAHNGFSIQTFITGIGAILGSAFPFLLAYWFTPGENQNLQVSYAFYTAAIILLISVFWTLWNSEEHPFQRQYDRKPLKESLKKYWAFMPPVMKKLAWVQFFSWFAFFNMWVFSTPGIASHFFHQTDSRTAMYNKAADWVGVLFAIYSGFSAVYALCIPQIIRKIGSVRTHALSLIAGGLSFGAMFVVSDYKILPLLMPGVGAAWGSVLTMPYSILLQDIPKANMGAYMGVFNIFITLPQLVSGLVGGWILSYIFNYHSMSMMYLSAISLILAGILTVILLKRT